MGCPFYKDFTRECVEEFKGLVNFSMFTICESEGYTDCIFYNSITYPEKRCEFDDQCICMHLDIPLEHFQLDINGLNQMAKHFCFTKNRENCAIYKRIKAGQEVSPFLHPDGSMLAIDKL